MDLCRWCLLMMQTAANRIAAEIGRDELVLLLALGLIGAGLWQVWWPGTFIVPGLVLLWLALPSRAPFVARESDPRRKR